MTTAIERLEALLNAKDEELAEMRETVRQADALIDAAEAGWSLPRAYPEAERWDGPVPRLEMVWIDKSSRNAPWTRHVCEYRLVVEHYINGLQIIPMGRTTTEGGSSYEPGSSGEVLSALPRRDGVHIFHDAAHLRLPAYALLPRQKPTRIDVTHDGWFATVLAKGRSHRIEPMEDKP